MFMLQFAILSRISSQFNVFFSQSLREILKGWGAFWHSFFPCIILQYLPTSNL